MKNYKINQVVRWHAKDFDGDFAELATITETHEDYAIATEADGTTLWIDNYTDYQFTIL